ncbi:hypothetical protein YQE_06361, partial [Dendroctonus ponderosae]
MNLSSIKNVSNILKLQTLVSRCIHTTAVRDKNQAGRYRITPRKNFPLTYEMANPPHEIAHKKSWNSWNTQSAGRTEAIRNSCGGPIHTKIYAWYLACLISK